MRCPNCWDRKVGVQTTHWLDRFLCRLLFLVPIRCRHCSYAFYVSRWSYGKAAKARTELHTGQRPALSVRGKFPDRVAAKNQGPKIRRQAA